MRQFLDLVRENKTLRKKVEEGLREANKSLALARGIMSDQVAETALLCPSQEVTLELGSKNIMSVDVPVYTAKTRTPNEDDIFCYGLAFTPVELDSAISELNSLLPDLLRLAQVEKSVQMMAVEIEKTRRRVNALEHVMIPRYVDTIRMITMKLDENERSNTARLMKVKDMMIQEQYSAKQQA